MLCHLTFSSPLRVFNVLRLVASEVAYSHWLHLYDFSMLFDNVFPKIVCLGSATFPLTLITFIRFYLKIISLHCVFPHAICSDKCYI